MKKLLTTALVAAFGIALGSCNKLVEGYDVNPNAAQDSPANLQLRAAELSEGFVMSGEMARLTNIWSNVFTGADRQYSSFGNYLTAPADYDNAWTNIYQTTLTQLRIVEDKATASGDARLLGIAQVVEAQMLGTTTALWGDVPYSEAFVPGAPGKFDTQASVYAATQALLTTALANLAKPGTATSTDIYFGGSATSWTAVAHSLKARYYLHVKNYAQAAAEAAQGIKSSAGDMLVPYPGTAIGKNVNPYYDFIDNSRSGYMSADNAYAAALLQDRTNAKTDETGRFDYFYISDPVNGYFDLDPNFETGAFAPDASFPLITYVETQAILAESLVRTGNLPEALTALNNIRAYDQDTYGGYAAYTLTDFASGGLLNATSAGLTQTDALLKEVLTEKYLSLIGQIEEFNDLRRTNNLIGVPKTVSSAPSIPQRLLYPQNEANTNPNIPNPIPALFTKTPVNQ